jgi:hypothetical protein
MLLITFVELRVVAGRSRTRAGRPQAVLCRGLEKNSMVGAGHGRGMASVNQTRPHYVNQMGKTHSKPSAARHGIGAAWARHAMCESALRSRQALFASYAHAHKRRKPIAPTRFGSYRAIFRLNTIMYRQYMAFFSLYNCIQSEDNVL